MIHWWKYWKFKHFSYWFVSYLEKYFWPWRGFRNFPKFFSIVKYQNTKFLKTKIILDSWSPYFTKIHLVTLLLFRFIQSFITLQIFLYTYIHTYTVRKIYRKTLTRQIKLKQQNIKSESCVWYDMYDKGTEQKTTKKCITSTF